MKQKSKINTYIDSAIYKEMRKMAIDLNISWSKLLEFTMILMLKNCRGIENKDTLLATILSEIESFKKETH